MNNPKTLGISSELMLSALQSFAKKMTSYKVWNVSLFGIANQSVWVTTGQVYVEKLLGDPSPLPLQE